MFLFMRTDYDLHACAGFPLQWNFYLQSGHVIAFFLLGLHVPKHEFILQRGKAAIGPCFEFCFQILQSNM